MNTKKKLKAKVRKFRLETKLLRSDLLVDIESLTYRALFAEGQVRDLMRENCSLKERIRSIGDKKNEQQEQSGGVAEALANQIASATHDYPSDASTPVSGG